MFGTLNTLATLLAFASQPLPGAATTTAQTAPIAATEQSSASIEAILPQVEPAPIILAQVTEDAAPDPAPIETAQTPALDPGARPITPTDPDIQPDIRVQLPAEVVADPTIVSPTERRAILKAASEAMSSVVTAKGRFTQIAPDFSLTTGDFALRRPGRVRFAYDAPVPILIVADGTTVAIEDSELETVDRVPLSSTPLKLVLDDNIDFETEAEITNVQRANGVIAISMRDRSGETDGILTLILDARSYDLLSWRAIDEAGGITTVSLEDIEKNTRLSARLFRLDDPEDRDEDDRR